MVRAEKVGKAYKIWLKWTGYDAPTFRWRHELVNEGVSGWLAEDIERAVQAEKDRLTTTRQSDETQPPTPPSPHVEQPGEPAAVSAHGRPVRVRKRAVQHNVGLFLMDALARRSIEGELFYVSPLWMYAR